MKEDRMKVLLYLKRSARDKSGKCPIMGRITIGRTMAQFSCKLSCSPSLWNVRESRLDGKGKEAVETNARIERLLADIGAAYDSLCRRGITPDASAVKDLFQGSVRTQVTLLGYYDKWLDEMRNHVGADVSKSRIGQMRAFRKTLAAFLKHSYKTADLAFCQITDIFISEFNDYLLGHRGLSVNTANGYLALLKRTCRLAYKDGLTERLLFGNFTIRSPRETTPKALCLDDFIKIRDLKIASKRSKMAYTRDIFLFACYTGTAYIDAVSVKRDNVVTDDDGKRWLIYDRKKTKVIARVRLLPEAEMLIKKYESTTREELFPYIPYDTMRENLGRIGDLTGISGLHFHQGRHTFASLVTLDNGVPIETISKMLGHSDVRMTQRYARVTQRKVFEDMERFIAATSDFVLTL